MKKRLYQIVITATVVCFTACNPQPEAPTLLQQAQAVIETHPDSAMQLIDSIFYPEGTLEKKHYMQYLVTRVQARYKNFRPVAEDTLIFKVRDYFTAHDKDLKQSTLAWFYSGCVYREQKNTPRPSANTKKPCATH